MQFNEAGIISVLVGSCLTGITGQVFRGEIVDVLLAPCSAFRFSWRHAQLSVLTVRAKSKSRNQTSKMPPNFVCISMNLFNANREDCPTNGEARRHPPFDAAVADA
jgi:hypothetical protein